MKKYKLKRSLITFLIAHFFEYILYYMAALTCLYFLHYFQAMLPELAKELGDMATKKEGLINVPLMQFFWLALAIIIFRTGSRLLFFIPARYQQRDLRLELVSLLENSHPKNYAAFNAGQIYQVTFNDINRIRGFVGFGLLQVGNIIIALYIIIPKVINFNSQLLYAFTPLLAGVVVFSVLSIFFQPLQRKTTAAQGEVQNFIIESYGGKATIQNYHGEKSFFTNFINLSKVELRYFFLSTIGPTFSIPIIRLTFGASLLWGAYLVKSLGLGASSLIYFSGVLFLVLEPLAFLSWIGVVFISGYTGWRRIKEIVDSVNIDSDLSDEEFSQEVNLDFWNSKVTLEIKKDQWTVLVGETGCGKSFLLRSFADDLNKHQVKFSMVAQEPYLYNDTVADNIFLGRSPSTQEVENCAELITLFGLDVLASSAKDVLKMEVGENGKKVSGGQAKRICLLRSVFAQVDYLLWDDPFSSVDLILEKEIIMKLKASKHFQGKTVVLSSHRLSTVKNCQQIIYLDKNIGIVENGPITELLAKKSLV
ncbi:ABC transporter ATP-binding protein/permease, partial [Bacteriovoracaceae bacterium]|nr:ABC transporter ATP-binding protein/permease [Bacteriovoracaceae bacterium]